MRPRSKSLIAATESSVINCGSRLALMDSTLNLSYDELWARLSQLGSGLRDLGVRKGDRVLLHSGNSVTFVLLYYAVLFAGGTVCPIDDRASSPTFLAQARNISPKAALLSRVNLARHETYCGGTKVLLAALDCMVLTEPGLSSDDSSLARRPLSWSILEGGDASSTPTRTNSGDLAQIIHTTGTTGSLKAVTLTHGQMLSACANIASIVALSSTDIEVTTLPLTRLFGQFHVHCYLQTGGVIAIEPNLQKPEESLRRVLDLRATSFPQVMSAFKLLMNENPNLLRECDACLRYVMLCSMKSEPGDLDRLQQHLPSTDIVNTYGLSEAVRCTYVNVTQEPLKKNSVGRPVRGVRIKIMDPRGAPVSPFTAGEIAVASPHMSQGYWNNPAATARTVHKGWLATGDLGYMDEAGYLYFLGRKSDEINVAGQKFMPTEIEDLVKYGVPEAAEAAVVGVPDPDGVLGQIPFLFVQVLPGTALRPRDVQRFLVTRVETFKIPRYVAIVPELPLSESGKILRGVLFERACTILAAKA